MVYFRRPQDPKNVVELDKEVRFKDAGMCLVIFLTYTKVSHVHAQTHTHTLY